MPECTRGEPHAQSARNSSAPDDGTIRLQLPYRSPFAADDLIAFLGTRAVAGVEEAVGNTYRRVLSLPHGTGVAALHAPPSLGGEGHVTCELQLSDRRDLPVAIERCRRLLDLDADPQAIMEVLGADPLLSPLVAARPGLRVPGHVDPDELAVRAVLGQQVSVAAARTLAGRLVQRYGEPLRHPVGTLTHAFPTAAALAAVDPEELPMPRARRRALLALAGALASGSVRLDPGGDREEVSRQLLSLPGIGPWTVSYIRMRALSDRDAFLPTDLGVRRALERLGQPADPESARRAAERWRPWRAYALQYLWAALGSPEHP